MLFNKPVNQISKEEFEDFIAQKKIEGREHDYKIILPDGKNQRDGYDPINEFAKDVCAFANSIGGYLIFGVKENSGEPTDICGVEIEKDNFERLKQKLLDYVTSNIEPTIQGISFGCIEGFEDGKSVVIMYIPKSFLAPHMVRKDRAFYYRADSKNERMDVAQVRESFLSFENLRDKIINYSNGRILRLIQKETPFELSETPTAVLQLIPFSSFDFSNIDIVPGFINVNEYGIKSCINKSPYLALWGSDSRHAIDPCSYNIDGCLKCVNKNYIQIYTNGIIESLDNYTFDYYKIEYGNNKFYINDYATNISLKVKQYLDLFKELNIMTPIYVSFSLLSIKNYIAISKYGISAIPINSVKFQKDSLSTDSIINNYEQNEVNRAIKQMLDRMYRAFGVSECPTDIIH